MIISLNWIKEFVDLSGIEVDELTKRFGLSTAEIESVTHVGNDLKNIAVAQILSVENHPQSDHLHILKVDDGSGSPVQVVCGAPNVRVGLKTFFCRVGGQVKDMKIKPVKMVGVESNGMCCGGNELGIEADTSGIVELDESAVVGTDIHELLPVEDVLIEIDNKSLTNRPDLWGHYGIAREFAAIFNRPLKPLVLDDLSAYNGLPKLNIKVETKNCFRYTGITVNNISRKTSTPLMKLRLNYCGMRDINLLADLTNYIMLELGQPMHAFDNAIVKGINVIENSRPLEMLTLEGEKHEIPTNSIVICDETNTPVAVAGIKGGLKSGITEKTNSLLIESACFDSATIRKTSRKIGLITDASLRYEKSLDPELCAAASARMLHLLKQADKNVKVTSAFTDVYNYKYPHITINTTAEFISKRGGVNLSAEKITEILTRLGFTVKNSAGNLTVEVPSFRATKDVSIREDLVEEVFRMYGYDNIKSAPMSMPLTPVDKIPTHEVEYQIKHALSSCFNLNEVHSYVWNYIDFNKQIGINQQSVVHLMDASKSGQSGLRTMLTPTLLKFADENKNKFADISIFEIGRTFDELDENNLVNEKKKLSVVLASETETDKSLYFKLKQMVEYIAENIYNTNVSFVMSGENADNASNVTSECLKSEDVTQGGTGECLKSESNTNGGSGECKCKNEGCAKSEDVTQGGTGECLKSESVTNGGASECKCNNGSTQSESNTNGGIGECLHPVNSCRIVCNGTTVGSFGVLHPSISKKIDKRKQFACLEMDVNKMLNAPKVQQKIIHTSKFQPTSLDFNFVADKSMPYSKLDDAIKNFKCAYILEYALKDVYTNNETLPGKISYTINITITPKDKTLTSEDIEKFSSRFIRTITQLGVTLRS